VRDQKREDATGGAERQDCQDDQSIGPPLKLKVEQKEDGQEADGDDDRESLLLFAQGVKLTSPGVRISLRKLDLGADLLLQILDGGGQVTVANTELYRNVAATAFAVDHEATFSNGDIGDL
jgi:hypothetical protein